MKIEPKTSAPPTKGLPEDPGKAPQRGCKACLSSLTRKFYLMLFPNIPCFCSFSSPCVRGEAVKQPLKTQMGIPIKTVSHSGCRRQVGASEVRLHALEENIAPQKSPPYRQKVCFLFKRSFKFLRKFSEAPFPYGLAARSCTKYLRAIY